MKITIECECGNVVVLPVQPKKYIQFRDWLETKQFHYDGAEIEHGKLKEICIQCDKCKNWSTFGMD